MASSRGPPQFCAEKENLPRKDIILKVFMTHIVPLLVEVNGRFKRDVDMCAPVHRRIAGRIERV